MTDWTSELSSLKAHLLASDPGLQRLWSAIRSVMGLGLTILIAWPIIKISGQPMTLAFLGGVLAMLGPLMVADPKPAQQRFTQLLLLLPVLLSLTLGMVLSPDKQASLLCFVVLSFTSVAMRRWGLRYLGLGMMSLMSFFFTLFFRLPLDSLPWACVMAILATGVMYSLRFWILPERPARLLTLSRRSFNARLGICLDALAELLTGPEPSVKQWRSLQKHWLRLGEQAQGLEILSAENAPEQATIAFLLKQQLHEQELAIGRLIETSWILRQIGTREARANSATLLLILSKQLAQKNQTSHARCAELESKLDQLQKQASLAPEPILARVLLSQYEAIKQCWQPDWRNSQIAFDPPDTVPDFSEQAVSAKPKLHAATRQAIQASFATGLASLAGGALAPDYWAWGALSAFVIFLGSTRGNYLLRAWQRVLGTALGLGAGMLLAYLLTRAPGVEMALLLLTVFGGIYLIKVAYAWAMFCFSAQIALLYSLMGKLTPALMELRLLETLIGAGCGALVAVLVLPIHTRSAIRVALAEGFEQVCVLLKSLQSSSTSQLMTQTRGFDAKVRELHDLATPLLDLRLPQGSLRLRGILQDLQHLSYYLRQLARWSDETAELKTQTQELAQKAEIMAQELRQRLPDKTSGPPLLVSLLLETLPLPATSVPICHWLSRIEHLLNRLAQRLELEAEL